jgi:hypothetical protein
VLPLFSPVGQAKIDGNQAGTHPCSRWRSSLRPLCLPGDAQVLRVSNAAFAWSWDLVPRVRLKMCRDRFAATHSFRFDRVEARR